MSGRFSQEAGMRKLEEIRIGDVFYPVKIDLNVLEIIQDEFGSIGAWEMALKGWRYRTDENGNPVYDASGSPVMYRTEPSVRAIKTVLPAMINEGIAIRAERQGKPYDELSDLQIISECETDYTELAGMIREEFDRCFAVKKACRGKKGKQSR